MTNSSVETQPAKHEAAPAEPAPPAARQRWLPVVTVLMIIAVLTLWGVGLFFAGHHADPYVRSVLSLDGHPERGHEIFEINCAGCHGTYATGNVGPSLENVSRRKSDQMLIWQVISGETPPMPKFQPQPQAMADLLEYLKRL